DEPTAGVDPTSRRHFWTQIHRIAAEGTTVLVTTHYMDEAERCHRLAFIFGGRLLTVGTPEEIVASRGLSVVELEIDRPALAADVLRELEEVDEVSHYGHVLRVAFRAGVNGERLLAERLSARGFSIRRTERVRVTVEDAFVSTVRAEANGAEMAA